jgi:integrase
MARTIRDANLERAAARARLEVRGKPHWRLLEPGLHLGYRRLPVGGGTWVARRGVASGKYAETRIGVADDLQAADGISIFSFAQAQAAAREWWKASAREALGLPVSRGPYTVMNALDDYFEAREHRGSKGIDKDRAKAQLSIVPMLGNVELARLAAKQITDWLNNLAQTGKRSRTAKAAEPAEPKALDRKDGDAIRARRATANRILTTLKAALNHAYQSGHASSDDAWRRVKPFREVDAAVVQFLNDDEARRIVNACEGRFRDLVKGALLTGCRYGELTRMRVGDFNLAAGTITVRESKAGKPRHIALTDEGRRLFEQLTAGNAARDLVFTRDDGAQWGPSHQQRPLEAASGRAKLDPPATFHVLRHTYASSLAMRGVPMGVIAAQLGHADTRMTEKHYAHLAPNYVASTVRAALPSLGIVEPTAIARLR